MKLSTHQEIIKWGIAVAAVAFAIFVWAETTRAGIVVDPVTGFQTYVPDTWQPPPNWNQPLQPPPPPKTTTICWTVNGFLNCETQ